MWLMQVKKLLLLIQTRENQLSSYALKQQKFELETALGLMHDLSAEPYALENLDTACLLDSLQFWADVSIHIDYGAG